MEYPFFHDFDHFLEIEILSKEENSFYRWKGLIQARLRYLLLNFESETEDKVNIQLWPQEFNLYMVNQPEYKYACLYYIGLKAITFQNERLSLTSIMKQWKKSVYEQWEGDPKDNLVYAMTKKRNDLDHFVYNQIPKGFIKYEGKRDIFPQEKESTNLLSRLIPENQMYVANPVSMYNLQTSPAQPQIANIYNYQGFNPQSSSGSNSQENFAPHQPDAPHTSKHQPKNPGK